MPDNSSLANSVHMNSSLNQYNTIQFLDNRHTQLGTDIPDMIPYQNLLMVNQTVVIASVAASVT